MLLLDKVTLNRPNNKDKSCQMYGPVVCISQTLYKIMKNIQQSFKVLAELDYKP